jgi:VCBS repeat-containing protein
VAVNDAYGTTKDTVLNVAAPGVLTNDTDANLDPLTAVPVSSVSHGSLTLNSNGSFTYTPASGYSGPDSFTYRAYDGKAYSNTATVSITVYSSLATFGLNDGNITYPPGEDPNWISAMRFLNTAGSGNLTKLEILIDSSSPIKIRLGVYAENNGKPGALLLDAGEVTTTTGWVSISGLNLPVTQNTYYWLAVLSQSTISIRIQSGQPANSHYWDFRSYGALPAQFTFGSQSGSNAYQYVMRATVQLSAP